jgi:hypothetical protein
MSHFTKNRLDNSRPVFLVSIRTELPFALFLGAPCPDAAGDLRFPPSPLPPDSTAAALLPPRSAAASLFLSRVLLPLVRRPLPSRVEESIFPLRRRICSGAARSVVVLTGWSSSCCCCYWKPPLRLAVAEAARTGVVVDGEMPLLPEQRTRISLSCRLQAALRPAADAMGCHCKAAGATRHRVERAARQQSRAPN